MAVTGRCGELGAARRGDRSPGLLRRDSSEVTLATASGDCAAACGRWASSSTVDGEPLPPPRFVPMATNTAHRDSRVVVCARMGVSCPRMLVESCSSSPPLNLASFPSLCESARTIAKKKGYGPPFDTANRRFNHTFMAKDFPFEEIEENKLKLKCSSIQFCWPHLRRSRSSGDLEGKQSEPVEVIPNEGQFCDSSRWFRSPPKVRIVQGILGPHPLEDTHGTLPGEGDGKLVDDPESGHRSPKSSPTRCVEILDPAPK